MLRKASWQFATRPLPKLQLTTNMAISKFNKLKAKLSRKGVKDPGGLAYTIGVKKFGKAGMAKKAAAGRRKAKK